MQKSCTERESFTIRSFLLSYSFYTTSNGSSLGFLSCLSPCQVKTSPFVWNGGSLEKRDCGNDAFPIYMFLAGFFFQHLFLIFLWNLLLRFPTYCQLWLQLLNGMSMILSWWKSTQPTKLRKWTVFLSGSRPEHLSISHSRFPGLSYSEVPSSNPCNKPNSQWLYRGS